MFKKILVPLDGSELAEQALRPALTIARQKRGTLHLLSVPYLKQAVVAEPAGFGLLWPDQSIDRTRRELSDYLDGVRHRFADEIATFQTVVADGDEAGVIVDVAQAEAIDLIVMSTHGRSGLSRWMLGSVTERVLRNASCPVLAVRKPVSVQQVMITLDGSRLAEAALEPGLALAECFSADVTLFRVDERLPDLDPRWMTDLEDIEEGLGLRARADYLEASQTYLEGVRRRYAPEHPSLNIATRRGATAESILDYARSEEVELIVMASHGRSGLRRWVYGSVTEKVLRGDLSAVMVVRLPPADLV